MPDLIDPCLWCNDAYGHHQGGSIPHCLNYASGVRTGYDKVKVFAPQGSMGLRCFPISTKIAYYTKSSGYILEDATKITTRQSWGIATIRALTNPHIPPYNTMLLVWGGADTAASGAWDVHNTIPVYAKLTIPTDAYGFWVSKDTPVKYVVSMPSSIAVAQQMPVSKSGMACARQDCQTFNDFAEPNQSDGITYICYSCRRRGY